MVQQLEDRRRVKVSVTIDPALLYLVDQFVQEHPGRDRSSVFNAALLLWCGEQQEKAIAAQHRAPQSEAEQSERAAWHQTQATAIDRTYSQG